jgi:hypothetical protein
LEAQLTLRRNPVMVVVFLVAIAVALLLGGTAGYLVKPTSVTAGPGRLVIVSGYVQASPNADECIWINQHKGC